MRHFTGNGTNIETFHQTSLFHIESNLDRFRLLSPTHGQLSQHQSGQITLQSVLMDKPMFLKAIHHAQKMELKYEGPWCWWRPYPVEADARASIHLSKAPCIFAKSPTNLAFLPLHVDPRRKKTDRGQRSGFPSETSRFAPLILAHRGSALL